MEEIVKHINDTNASYRAINAGNAKNTDLFLDNEHYELFKDAGEQITVRFNKENLQKAILFIASILPRKFDNSGVHKIIEFSSDFVFDQLASLDAFFTIDGVKVQTRTQIWYSRKDVPKKNGEIDKRFYFNGLLENVSYRNSKGEMKTDKFTIRNYVAGGYSDLHIKKASDGIFDVWVTNTQTPYNDGKDKNTEILDDLSQPLQQIFYGAPGTGKSNTIKREVDEKELPCIRTTFHPDSDYSTFVGAYKPIMEVIDVKVTPVVVENGISLQPSGTYKERRIAYKFVKQAFLKAYLGAWKKYVDSGSIGNTYTSNEFDTGNGRYVINSVGVYDLNLSKEFTFPKSLVSKEWDNLWNNGIFNVPKGPQTGKSVQHAIANWITKNINDCNKDKFEEGWQKLSDTIREKGRVEVRKFDDQKSQTYIICKISDDNETLTINVEAQGKSKDTLRPKFNDVDNAKASKLEKALIEILKEYDSDFDKAWDNLKQTVDKGTSLEVKDHSDGYIVPQFLIIEEINRGNCAQIFGDIFQLLDRQENGFSEYPIEADTDIQNAIKTAFEEEKEYKLESAIDVDFAVENYTSNYDANATLSDDLQAGRVMLLPPNLYIWATMNTSDQSLFPIDSAFKRRWDWKYIPIGYKNDNWKIKIGKKDYNWVDFQRKINDKIYSVDNSEDKQLGDYFVNADQTGNEISSDTLLNKILFYLWNDVCKDDPDIIFKWDDDQDNNREKSIKFSEFFCEKAEKERKLQGFMAFLKVKADGDDEKKVEQNDDTTAGNDDVVKS